MGEVLLQEEALFQNEQPIALRVSEATKYLGNRKIFGNVSFSCEKQSILFICGPSGCGKSTLLRVVSCLDIPSVDDDCRELFSPTLGYNALLGGEEVTKWRSEIIYASQSRITRQGSPREMFELAQTFAAQKNRLDKHSSLDEIASLMSITSSMLNQNWSTLSGGEAQRCLLSVLVSLNPSVLLLDEPTSALDGVATQQVEELIKGRENMSCLWVTHDPTQPARVGGKKLILGGKRKGQIVSTSDEDPHEEEQEEQEQSDGELFDGEVILDGPIPTSEPGSSSRHSPSPFSPASLCSSDSPLREWGIPIILFSVAIILLCWQYFQIYPYAEEKGDENEEKKDPKPVQVPVLLGAFLVVLGVTITVSKVLRLEIGQSIVISMSRAVIQLTVLGLILGPIFRYNVAAFVLLYIFGMSMIASVESLSRIKYIYPYMGVHVWCSIAASLFIVASAGLSSLGVFLDAQYAIPICGMLLGNMMTGTSLCMNTLLGELHDQSHNTEVLLCMGATRLEASFEVLRKAVHTGLTPTIQSIAVLGLVSIPGMMTGQIMAGAPPEDAARYQLLIYMMIACSAVIVQMAAACLALWTCIDKDQRLRLDLLAQKQKVTSKWSVVIVGQIPEKE